MTRKVNRPHVPRGRRPGNVKPRNGLTSGKMKGGREGHAQAQAAAERAERRAKAWVLLREGATFRQIGEELGVSAKTAHGDVMTVYREMETGLRLDAEAFRAVQVDRTEAIYRAHAGRKGEPKSADILLRTLESQRRLVPGLEPERGSCPRCAAAEARALELARLLTSVFISLTPEAERRREWVAALRRRAPSLTLPAAAVPETGEAEAHDPVLEPGPAEV